VRGQGHGVTAGLFELSAYQHSDIRTWTQTFYGSAYVPPLTDVNIDGGFAAGYCAPAMGLVRICAATKRLQAAGTAALATGSSVVAAQSQAAVALART